MEGQRSPGDIPTADIEMKHAMSLVRIKILKNEYMGEGIVSNIRFDNVITRMTLDIRRETNSPDIRFARGSLQAGGNYHLNDGIRWWWRQSPPVYGYDQKAAVSFTIDGKEYAYEFHRDHEWEAGNEIHLYTEDRRKLQLPWSTWSRRTSMWSTGAGMARRTRLYSTRIGRLPFKVWPNYTEYGYDCYQNEGKVFGTFYNPYCDNGEESYGLYL